MTTPDPITAARAALSHIDAAIVRTLSAVDDLSTINSALDLAEKLKAERDEFAATIVSLAEHRNALTSQLDQAREIISPFADAARSFTVSIAPDGIDDGLTVGARIAVMPDYEAVLSTYHFSRASQWIKDRHEKQALSDLHTEEKRLGLDRQAKTDAIGDK